MTLNRYLVLGVVLTLSSCASAFFLDWGSSEQKTPAPQYYYHKRLLPNSGPIYTFGGNERQQIPTVPIQVPLPAQLTPVPNVQNVQLVPCLCPVSLENTYEQAQAESVFVNTLPVQQFQQQHIQQQQSQKI